VVPEQWGTAPRDSDLFDLKADVEAVLASCGCLDQVTFAAAEHPALHPGKSARVLRGGEPVGWLGALHPSLAAELDLPATVHLFELETGKLGGAPRPAFEPLSKFPSIRRDLAVVVDEDVSFDALRRCVVGAAGELLRDLTLFDVYLGDKVDSGRKSLALGLILQTTSQTLTDDDVNAVVERVLAALKAELRAELRA
jgi:phenylalanyl-tRNA synthetase beta chain